MTEGTGVTEMTMAVVEWFLLLPVVANLQMQLLCIIFGVAIVLVARAIVKMNVEEPNGITDFTSWAQIGLVTLVISVNIAIGIIHEGSAEEAAKVLEIFLHQMHVLSVTVSKVWFQQPM